MSWDKIVKDDYGQVGKLTFIDVDTNAAADISAYTTAQQMILTDPEGNAAIVTAAFDSDGSDGIIKYTIQSGDIDATGNWTVRGRVTTGSAQLSTEEHKFIVIE